MTGAADAGDGGAGDAVGPEDPSAEAMVREVEATRSALYGVVEGRDPGAVARACVELAGEAMALSTLDDAVRLERLIDAACEAMREHAIAVRGAALLLREPAAGEA